MNNYYKKAIEEHKENANHLEHHTKESIIALYIGLLSLTNQFIEEVME